MKADKQLIINKKITLGYNINQFFSETKYKIIFVPKFPTKNYYFKGPGYWTRANNEICILATKGKPKRVSGNVDRLVVDERREHSRKPDRIRTDIVKLCGDVPRIELFARQKVDGWDSWGNEV